MGECASGAGQAWVWFEGFASLWGGEVWVDVCGGSFSWGCGVVDGRGGCGGFAAAGGGAEVFSGVLAEGGGGSDVKGGIKGL